METTTALQLAALADNPNSPTQLEMDYSGYGGIGSSPSYTCIGRTRALELARGLQVSSSGFYQFGRLESWLLQQYEAYIIQSRCAGLASKQR